MSLAWWYMCGCAYACVCVCVCMVTRPEVWLYCITRTLMRNICKQDWSPSLQPLASPSSRDLCLTLIHSPSFFLSHIHFLLPHSSPPPGFSRHLPSSCHPVFTSLLTQTSTYRVQTLIVSVGRKYCNAEYTSNK